MLTYACAWVQLRFIPSALASLVRRGYFCISWTLGLGRPLSALHLVQAASAGVRIFDYTNSSIRENHSGFEGDSCNS
jgi:hypothetical protein